MPGVCRWITIIWLSAQVFWLATDRAYKTAEDAIARKRSSLKNVSLPDTLPDFSKARRRI